MRVDAVAQMMEKGTAVVELTLSGERQVVVGGVLASRQECRRARLVRDVPRYLLPLVTSSWGYRRALVCGPNHTLEEPFYLLWQNSELNASYAASF